MGAAETALRGVAESKKKPLITTGEGLQALGSTHGKYGGFAGQVGGFGISAAVARLGLDERIDAEQVGDTRHGHLFALVARHLGGVERVGEQPVRVVEGRPELLAAGEVFERRRDAALGRKTRRVNGLRRSEPRQRGAVRTHERDRFEHVALRL